MVPNTSPNTGSIMNVAPCLLTIMRLASWTARSIQWSAWGTTFSSTASRCSSRTPRAPPSTRPSTLALAGDAFDRVGQDCDLCDRVNAWTQHHEDLERRGGAGMILMNTFPASHNMNADAHVLPASHVDCDVNMAIISYIKSMANPLVHILFRGMRLGMSSAPVIVFSSRGLSP
jgi:hypothetical protein